MSDPIIAAVQELLDARAEAVAAQAKRDEQQRAANAAGYPYSWSGFTGGPTRVSLAEDALARLVGRTWPRDVFVPMPNCCAPNYFAVQLQAGAIDWHSGSMPTINPDQRYGR